MIKPVELMDSRHFKKRGFIISVINRQKGFNRKTVRKYLNQGKSESTQMQKRAPYQPQTKGKVDFQVSYVKKNLLTTQHTNYLNILNRNERNVFPDEGFAAAILDRLLHY